MSKQAIHQKIRRDRQVVNQESKFIEKAQRVRKDHPMLGCRKLAIKLKQPGMGRDKLERLLLQSGMRVSYPPNYTKTTQSVRRSAFPNLIKGLRLNGINQVVQTDITYLWVRNRFYYVVLIIDVYSRKIVGYEASDNMRVEGNITALKMMIKLRGKENVSGMIHHSDRGSQYHATDYLQLLEDNGIKISMCSEAWENAYTERLNRTVKDEYLKHRKIEDLQDLKKQLANVVKLYNESRPHWGLPGQLAPLAFETAVEENEKRPVMDLYAG